MRKPGPWVAKNVMPILGKSPIPIGLFQKLLSAWLSAWTPSTSWPTGPRTSSISAMR